MSLLTWLAKEISLELLDMEHTATLFPNIVGQDAAKRQLEFYLQGYNATSVIPHIMFTAPRGCGKTLMAKGLARHLKN